MNALEIIEELRARDAALLLEDNRLIVRGHGPRLPEKLRAALQEHKAEVMIALGANQESAVASILAEIRPALPPALGQLPDAKLLILVNWSILHAWGASLRKLSSS